MTGQLSLFGATAREPALADLDGLLAGNGQVVRRDATARLSIVVEQPWRVDALVRQLAEQLGTRRRDCDRPRSGVTVRTPWLAELLPIADALDPRSRQMPPPGWVLDGPRLRWWCLADGLAGGGHVYPCARRE